MVLHCCCDAVGDPFPAVQWYKSDDLIVGQTSEIFAVDRTSLHDSGIYHCVAGNIVANLTLPAANITVLGKNLSEYKRYTMRLQS